MTPMVVGNMASLAALLDVHDLDELMGRLPLFLAADGAKRGVKFGDRVAVKRHEYGAA